MAGPNDPCPCQRGAKYKRCCRALHRGAPAETPLPLMRSRYAVHYELAQLLADGPGQGTAAGMGWAELVAEAARHLPALRALPPPAREAELRELQATVRRLMAAARHLARRQSARRGIANGTEGLEGGADPGPRRRGARDQDQPPAGLDVGAQELDQAGVPN